MICVDFCSSIGRKEYVGYLIGLLSSHLRFCFILRIGPVPKSEARVQRTFSDTQDREFLFLISILEEKHSGLRAKRAFSSNHTVCASSISRRHILDSMMVHACMHPSS
jgi:hypothetical protein